MAMGFTVSDDLSLSDAEKTVRRAQFTTEESRSHKMLIMCALSMSVNLACLISDKERGDVSEFS